MVHSCKGLNMISLISAKDEVRTRSCHSLREGQGLSLRNGPGEF